MTDENKLIIKELKEIRREVHMLKEEITRGRSKQFDNAIEYVIDHETVPRSELTANFKSFGSSYYMARFKEYAEGFNIDIIDLPFRGRPEILIHTGGNPLLKKLVERWKTEGKKKQGIVNKGFSKEEWKELEGICHTKIKPIVENAGRRWHMDNFGMSWRKEMKRK